MFTDEKIFTTNGFFNPKNNVIWAESRSKANEEDGTHELEKHPISEMVALGATWNSLTKPYFYTGAEKLNKVSYCDLLKFYKKEGDRLFKSDNWNFQQDGASCHTSIKSQELCQNTFYFFIDKKHWPPNSPELNPLDYSIWNQISSNMDYKKINNQSSLVKEIKKSVSKIYINYLREVIGKFLVRVYSVEKNNGDLIFDKDS